MQPSKQIPRFPLDWIYINKYICPFRGLKWTLEAFSAREKRCFPLRYTSTFKVPLAPLLVTMVPPTISYKYERVSYSEPTKTRETTPFGCWSREENEPNTRVKMEILARSCRHQKCDISTSFQPIWMKQTTTQSSWGCEQCVFAAVARLLQIGKTNRVSVPRLIELDSITFGSS